MGIAVIIVVIILCAVFGSLAFYLVRKRKRRLARRRLEEARQNAEPAEEEEQEDEVITRLRGEREAVLEDAMKSGSVSVLAHALLEVEKQSKEIDLKPQLLAEARKRLSLWKKKTKLLDAALKTRDVKRIEISTRRFKKHSIIDETRVCADADELLAAVEEAKSALMKACASQDKVQLEKSILIYEALKLSLNYTSVDADYMSAKAALGVINENRKTTSREEVKARIALNVAIAQKDESAININLGVLYTTGCTDEDDDIKNGKKKLDEMRTQREQAKAWSEFEACMESRDAHVISQKFETCRLVQLPNTKLVEAEEYLEIVREEDELIEKIAKDLDDKNVSELKRSCALFRDSDSAFVDKTGKIEEAEAFIEWWDAAERQKEEIQKLKEEFANAQIAADMETMSAAVTNL